MSARWTVAAALSIALLGISCGGGDGGDSVAVPSEPCTAPGAPPARDAAANAFLNPSFEDGRDPWTSLATQAWGPPFALSDAQAVDGAMSAYLALRSEHGGSARVYGVVQEAAPDEMPDVVSGYYCVAHWEKGTPRQYVQFVVIAFEAENRPPALQGQANNHQIRYLLAGAAEQPTFITNARYVFVTRAEPAVGQWVYFELPVRADFEELWGDVPRGYSKLRLLFETRWDGRQPSDGPSAADVYFDDLYFGPAP